MRTNLFLHRWLCLWLAVAGWCGAVPVARAQVYKGIELVKADLLADIDSVSPGKPFTVGLRLKMAPRWHTYWQNSGDAGLPTKITWTLPEGFKAGPLQWPVPEKIVSEGDIVNYGYSEEVLLLTEITPPAQAPPGNVTLKAKADWLVCAELCIPGAKELELKLPAGGTPTAANADVFQSYRTRLPKAYDPAAGFKVATVAGSQNLDKNEAFVFTVQPLGADPARPVDPKSVDFYPLPEAGTELGHPEIAPRDAALYAVRVPIVSDPKPQARFAGLLVYGTGPGRVGWLLPWEALQTAKTDVGAAPVKPFLPPPSPIIGPKTTGGLWHFLLLGFLGGMILNVMPCVLPVISLKIFSFVKQADHAPERIFRMGLAYAAGVFAWFLGFAALVVALKAGGREVGYAFHLQNPWFIVGLSAAVFVFALNLLGVWEFILPGAAAGALTDASQRTEGYSGAFLQGVLATVLGSACTAPVFGAALGFAFAQSAPGVFAMFAAIALGMSFPFILLTAFPAWLRYLPKPGVWMERVKQATGFLMLATLLWLLSILGAMRGADAVVWAGVLLLAIGAACWVQGAFNTLTASGRTRAVSLAAVLLLLGAGAWLSLPQIANARLPEGGESARDFPARLQAALKEEGRPVFVDFTAAWCVNCKVNERTVLNRPPVQQALKAANAVFLTADYTNYEPAMTALIRQFGRAGVPLYVIYPADRKREPIVLPELITSQDVLDGLKAAAASRDAKLAANASVE